MAREELEDEVLKLRLKRKLLVDLVITSVKTVPDHSHVYPPTVVIKTLYTELQASSGPWNTFHFLFSAYHVTRSYKNAGSLMRESVHCITTSTNSSRS